MIKRFYIFLILSMLVMQVQAQLEINAGNWKTWFIPSVKPYRLTAAPTNKSEMAEVINIQKDLDSTDLQQIQYWSAGNPGYRWQDMISRLWMSDTSSNGVLAYLLVCVGTYDATVAAWDNKYAHKRLRPYDDSRIKAYVPKSESPSYPCEHSIAAGVASTIIAHYYPYLADSVKRMANRAMASRVAAGAAFPSDTKAGFELGKRIAEQEMIYTKDLITKKVWDGTRPKGSGIWQGQPFFPMVGYNKTIVLDSSSQYRPGPPPDFAKEMLEMKNFKQTFRSKANALYYASQASGDILLNQKMFEYNLNLNPPRVARLFALNAIASYDAFVACFDAKYAYWGIRPDQYDTTYVPLVPTPPFPGYPSGHAVMSGMNGELYSYFFPAERALFLRKAKEGAESRFQAGIHFRTDNEVGLDLGRKVGAAIIAKAKQDGADESPLLFSNK